MAVKRKDAKSAKRRDKTPSGRKTGIQPVGLRNTVDDYAEALEKANGRFIECAEILGVSASVVCEMVAKYPRLQEIRRNTKLKRLQTAQSVIDEFMDKKNKDKPTRLRAATFTLSTESDEHRQKSDVAVSGGLDVRLPELNVRFLRPGDRLPESNCDHGDENGLNGGDTEASAGETT